MRKLKITLVIPKSRTLAGRSRTNSVPTVMLRVEAKLPPITAPASRARPTKVEMLQKL
jgi:hypothetical protein